MYSQKTPQIVLFPSKLSQLLSDTSELGCEMKMSQRGPHLELLSQTPY